jgi:hypothetical protein
MSIESAIEQKIREAMERGEFDDLAGKGKPLDLDAYFNTPEDLRMAYSILKSNEFVPEEVEIFREIAELQKKLEATTEENQRIELSKRLGERRLAIRLLLERRTRR